MSCHIASQRRGQRTSQTVATVHTLTIGRHIGMLQERLDMNIFDRANEALRHDLEAYTRALRTIVIALPQARELCDCVVKETRLARALLAFSNSPQMADLAQLAFHL